MGRRPAGPSEARDSPPVPHRRAGDDAELVHRILDFALRAGGVMLSSGASTIDVESTIVDLAPACGLDGCEVDVTFTSMTASCVGSRGAEPVTTLQVVRRRTVDYARLAGVYELRLDMVAGRITPEAAFARLDALLGSSRRRRDVVLLSWAGMAAAFTLLLGGAVVVAAVAFASTAVVYRVNLTLSRRGIPDFYLSALGASVATGFAMLLTALKAPVVASLVVAGGIMVLVPGYALVASVQDALTGFPISGGARGLEVLLTATGIITGVAVTLDASASVGLPVHLYSVALPPIVRAPVQIAAAGVAASLYGAATSVPLRSLLAAGATGASGWGCYLALRHAGASLILGTAVAAVVVGGIGSVVAARRRTHPYVLIVPGIMPLVPGLTIYQGMLQLFNGSGGGPATLLLALGMGLAIAAGVTLGTTAVRPLRRVPGPLRR